MNAQAEKFANKWYMIEYVMGSRIEKSEGYKTKKECLYEWTKLAKAQVRNARLKARLNK